LFVKTVRRGGPLLASALVLAAAAASLFGPSPVAHVVGSPWFMAGAVLTALLSLAAAAVSTRRRAWASVLLHFGLVTCLAGVAVNQFIPRSGYLFLEQAGGSANFYLDRNLGRIDDLPFTVGLDSLSGREARGFRPSMIAWISSGRESAAPVTYNRPLTLAGRQLLFSRMVEPGFLLDYELTVGDEQYLLMHNQVARPAGGPNIWSFAYDAEEKRVGLMVGGVEQWLSTGQTATLGGRSLTIESASFAAGPGVILVVNDIRFRFVVFAGFALVLLGLLPPLLRRPGTEAYHQDTKTLSGSDSGREA
jgi:hypothetical protein